MPTGVCAIVPPSSHSRPVHNMLPSQPIENAKLSDALEDYIKELKRLNHQVTAVKFWAGMFLLFAGLAVLLGLALKNLSLLVAGVSWLLSFWINALALMGMEAEKKAASEAEAVLAKIRAGAEEDNAEEDFFSPICMN